MGTGYLKKVVVQQNRILINPKLRWTFYRNVYICEQCQKGRELRVEEHSFNRINPLIGKALRPLIA